MRPLDNVTDVDVSDEVPQRASRVLAVVDRESDLRIPANRYRHVLITASAMRRARELLRSMLVLDREDHHDAQAILGRAIFECWLLGLLALWGSDDDIDRIAEATDRSNRALANNWPDPATAAAVQDRFSESLYSETDHPSGWPIEQQVHRLAQLYAQRGPDRDPEIPVFAYNALYRMQSHLATHANLESIFRYGYRHEREGREPVAMPRVGPDEGRPQLDLATRLLAGLAIALDAEFNGGTVTAEVEAVFS